MIGSNCVLQINEKRIRARQYPWGIAEVENSDHCDFKILRDMLIRTHMQVNVTIIKRSNEVITDRSIWLTCFDPNYYRVLPNI